MGPILVSFLLNIYPQANADRADFDDFYLNIG
jgi:hypothetical protein